RLNIRWEVRRLPARDRERSDSPHGRSAWPAIRCAACRCPATESLRRARAEPHSRSRPNDDATPDASERAVTQDETPVDDDVRNTDRIAMGPLERRGIGHGGGIEDDGV